MNNKEGSKRNDHYKIILIACLALVFVIVIVIAGFMLFQKQSDEYCMTFNGKKISMGDYEFFRLYSEDYDAAIGSLTEFLLIEKAANEKNIVLTEGEKAKVAENVQELKNSIVSSGRKMPDITDQRLAEILAVDIYYVYLMNEFVENYEVDELSFLMEFSNYQANYQSDYIDIELKYVITDSLEEAEMARNELIGGVPVDDVIRKYSVVYTPEVGIEMVHMNEISLDQETVDELLLLNAKEPTGIINKGDAFIVFVADKINIPTYEELDDYFRNIYVKNKALELFLMALEDWRVETKFSINKKAIDSLSQ